MLEVIVYGSKGLVPWDVWVKHDDVRISLVHVCQVRACVAILNRATESLKNREAGQASNALLKCLGISTESLEIAPKISYYYSNSSSRESNPVVQAEKPEGHGPLHPHIV